VAAGEAVQPALVLWPENSTDLDPYRDPATAALIDGAVDAIDAPTLIGAVVETDGGARLANTSIVWSPATGPGDTYVKRHPVPFGEFIPFRSLLEGWITRLDRVPRDFIAGDEIGVLQVGPARAAIAICFEIADDPIVREHVAAGGQFIAVQTNNATYGLTGQPEQQLEISRLRAMEHGRTVAIAATSGISAEITPDGVIRQQTAEFTQQVLAVDLGLSEAQTPATRYGGWVELGFVIWAAFGVGVTMLSRRRAPAPDRPERSAAA
jgi:apolipoprotein N-acyltransferase